MADKLRVPVAVDLPGDARWLLQNLSTDDQG